MASLANLHVKGSKYGKRVVNLCAFSFTSTCLSALRMQTSTCKWPVRHHYGCRLSVYKMTLIIIHLHVEKRRANRFPFFKQRIKKGRFFLIILTRFNWIWWVDCHLVNKREDRQLILKWTELGLFSKDVSKIVGHARRKGTKVLSTCMLTRNTISVAKDKQNKRIVLKLNKAKKGKESCRSNDWLNNQQTQSPLFALFFNFSWQPPVKKSFLLQKKNETYGVLTIFYLRSTVAIRHKIGGR